MDQAAFTLFSRCLFYKALVSSELKDLNDKVLVKRALKSCFSSKQLGNEEFLADLVGNACSKCYVSIVDMFLSKMYKMNEIRKTK